MGSFYVNPVRIIVLWLKKLRKPNIKRHETKKKKQKNYVPSISHYVFLKRYGKFYVIFTKVSIRYTLKKLIGTLMQI